jgi:hypothetical protein
VKLKPLQKWVIGRIAITKVSSTIVLSDATKNVTKFALLEVVSPEAEAAGFKPGDLVMAKTMHNIFLKGGSYHRVTFPIDEAVCLAEGVPMDDLLDAYGNPFLPVDERAA